MPARRDGAYQLPTLPRLRGVARRCRQRRAASKVAAGAQHASRTLSPNPRRVRCHAFAAAAIFAVLYGARFARRVPGAAAAAR